MSLFPEINPRLAALGWVSEALEAEGVEEPEVLAAALIEAAERERVSIEQVVEWCRLAIRRAGDDQDRAAAGRAAVELPRVRPAGQRDVSRERRRGGGV